MLNVFSATSVLFTVLTFVGFAALENLKDSKDINRPWENIKDNIKTSAQESIGLDELKQHKSYCYEEWLGFLDQRKKARMKELQQPNQSNVHNLNNVRCEDSRHFRNK